MVPGPSDVPELLAGRIVYSTNGEGKGWDTKEINSTLRLRFLPATSCWTPHYVDIRIADVNHQYGDHIARKVYHDGVIGGEFFEKNCDAPCNSLIEAQLFSAVAG